MSIKLCCTKKLMRKNVKTDNSQKERNIYITYAKETK